MGVTKIEWCHFTFNPWIGCVKVSPGCANCYAERDHRRMAFGNLWGPDAPRRVTSDAYWRQPLKWNRDAEKSGERKRVFCGSMCDVMEDRADLQPIRERLYPLVRETSWLDWLLLTKRPDKFDWLPHSWWAKPLPNVWLMTTVENNEWAWRINELRQVPAVVRGLSLEPLLGPLPNLNLEGIHWVIVGGESGPNARPCDVQWIRDVVRQCKDAAVPCFVKQLGARPHDGAATLMGLRRHNGDERLYLKFKHRKGADPSEWPEDLRHQQRPNA